MTGEDLQQGLWSLTLLGAWGLYWNGNPRIVSARQQHLLTALALHGRRSRAYLAGLLWPDSPQVRAAGSLRSCIWQLVHQFPGLLAGTHDPVSLNPGVQVDLAVVRACLTSIEEQVPEAYSVASLRLLDDAELLPGTYTDWIVFSQERLRLRRLNAAEALADEFLARGSYNVATDAASLALAIEPLRESAERLLIRSYLAAGNQAEAMNGYGVFRSRVRQQIGSEPSADTRRLIWPDLEHVEN
jgi:DNA-binding SARP family transcriptional activator